ncbi:EAL domain-containing protein [Dechloromonas sp. A34]|uniref:EAL domain-containing protein n=1 Tax=Dechloromonas sp. A34 TaxID=447588 RepID=UPI002249449D|nr:EAL domain-containing protein [Dechloromonas sp. A34]
MNSTLTGRILLPFVVVACIVLAVLFALEQVGRRGDTAHEVERRLITVQLQLREISAQVQGGILTGQERFAIQAANAALEADRQLVALGRLRHDTGELGSHFENYYAGMVALNSLFLENRAEEGTQRLAGMRDLQGQIDEHVNVMREAARIDRARLARLAVIAEIVSAVALLGALFLMAALLMRRVAKPVKHLAHAVEGIAEKAELDLEQLKNLLPAAKAHAGPSWPPARLNDELGSLLQSFQRMVELLDHEREALRLAASVFQNSREGILITDPDANIIDVNEAFSRITGYPREEAIGRNPHILRSNRQDAAFYQAMWQALAGQGFWSGEIWNRHKNGHDYPQLLTINTVRDAAGKATHYVAVFTDITRIKLHETELEHSAHYDALTGVPNRVLLADRMGQAIALSRREKKLMAVSYLDLDGFKPINDRYGHAAGDRLLVEITRRLKGLLRGSDTIARLGGDEFVFLLLGMEGSPQCTATLERILEVIAQPVDLGGYAVSVSASIGVTLYPLDDGDPDTLLRHADQAMYQAKEAGRNRYHFYDPEQDRRAVSHREAVSRIAQALESGELELHYQPKVDMRAGKVIGAEALIRWRHPQRGLLPPMEFLPVVEHTEIDLAIGQWVVRTALQQMQSWRASGFDLQVSVNISAHHLQHENFETWLSGMLAAFPDVPPACLQLEVLETTAFDDIVNVSAVMRQCREKGVGFALDDFGTGYSSLTYLRRLPIDVLKIDRSFVGDILTDPEDLAIVQSVIALARAFGHSVVAEGVETAEHGLILLGLGCDQAQGWGIAAAMPAADFPGWARDWRPDPRWRENAQQSL